MASYCESFCSHGGVCTREPGHDGLHGSRYCTWTDDEALDRDAADEVLNMKPNGRDVTAIWDIIGL